jgi:hypothetical protein
MPEPFVLTDEMRRILDALPQEVPSRSKLKPLRTYILRWRRDGRSYRQIQDILRDTCGIQVARQSIYQFVRRHERPRKRGDSEPEHFGETGNLAEKSEAFAGPVKAGGVPKPELRPKPEPEFDFDPTQPLINKNFWRK